MNGKLTGLTFAAVAFMPALMLDSRSEAQPSRTAPALATVAQFHEFLARGDSAKAARLLAPDAVILENGDRETRAEYIAHHLSEDMKFARAVPGTRTIVDARREGEVVWVVSTSVAKGRFGDRQINSQGAELMVLSRSGERWLIRAIHWSSHRVAP